MAEDEKDRWSKETMFSKCNLMYRPWSGIILFIELYLNVEVPLRGPLCAREI
jgi:hypothetical protein